MIKSKIIDGFQSKIGNSSLDYPKSSNPYLFKLFFNYLGVASSGGGKTYNLVKIIKEFENSELYSENLQNSHKILSLQKIIEISYFLAKILKINTK